MQLGSIPLFTELSDSKHILLAGAGGGYDVFSALPLYFSLREQNKTVTLASLAFSSLQFVEERLTDHLVKVTPTSSGSTTYFPERYLSEWFQSQGEDVPIYAIERTGAIPIREGYQKLIDDLQIDAVVLVDGGTDSLMRGDEDGLGTPHEDIASIAAVDELNVKKKYLACLGFGIDAFHGVCHAHYLEAVAELTRTGDYLGAFSLLPEMKEAKLYRSASEYVFQKMSSHVSIVTSSILSAVQGMYGDFHATDRTAGSELWINPLMALYWCFRLGGVAKRIIYLDAMKRTNNYLEVDDVFSQLLVARSTTREHRDIPL